MSETTPPKPAQTVGSYLQSVREELGVSIEEISEITKINARFLTAIETGDYSVLPGEAFCRGFIKSYSRYLGLDETEALARYDCDLQGRSFEPESFRRQLSEASQASQPTSNMDGLDTVPSLRKGRPMQRSYAKLASNLFTVLIVVVGLSIGVRFIVKLTSSKVDVDTPASDDTTTTTSAAESATPQPPGPSPQVDDAPTPVAQSAAPKQKATAAKSAPEPTPKPTPKPAVTKEPPTVKPAATPAASPNEPAQQERPDEQQQQQPAAARTSDKSPDASTLTLRVVKPVTIKATLDDKVVKNSSFDQGAKFIWTFKKSIELDVSDLTHIELMYNDIVVPTKGQWGSNRRLVFTNQAAQ
jgi:cytoskeleton protein RodZ